MSNEKITTVTDVFKLALETWGAAAQTTMVFEEMAELQKELCKNLRGRDNTDAIAEEIADVLIMLDQMIELHGIWEKVDAFYDAKIERLRRAVGDRGQKRRHRLCKPGRAGQDQRGHRVKEDVIMKKVV